MRTGIKANHSRWMKRGKDEEPAQTSDTAANESWASPPPQTPPTPPRARPPDHPTGACGRDHRPHRTPTFAHLNRILVRGVWVGVIRVTEYLDPVPNPVRPWGSLTLTGKRGARCSLKCLGKALVHSPVLFSRESLANNNPTGHLHYPSYGREHGGILTEQTSSRGLPQA